MRLLILGAGATGGFYGERLLQVGRDVTFLVRPRRAQQLERSGLTIRSTLGDSYIAAPPFITSVDSPFDLIILSCKAYQLEDAIKAIAPAVGNDSIILPILNGMKHLEILDRHFGKQHVLGGACLVSSTLDAEGTILQFGEVRTLIFGEREGSISSRCSEIAEFMATANFTVRLSENVMQDMWEKWVANSTIAGITALMRNSIGNIVSAPGGKELVLQLFDECSSVASAYNFPPRQNFKQRQIDFMSDTTSEIKASMCRDVERGAPTEADHVLGDMIAHAEKKNISVPMLRVAYCGIKAYDIMRSKHGQHPNAIENASTSASENEATFVLSPSTASTVNSI